MTLAVAAAAVALVQAPIIEMSITSAGKEIGRAWLTQKLEGGSKKTYAKLILGNVRIVETAEYAMDGTPKVKSLTRTENGKDERIEARFESGKLRLINGAEVTTVDFPSGSLKAKSEFWFLQTKPPINHVVEYQRFDLSTRKFAACKVVYVGRESISVAGKKHNANKVRVDDKTDAWLDERGDPLRMVIDGKTKFERVSR
jgi:hypothetical protein